MKVLVTCVGGQLCHDVMNELAKRGYEGVGSDIAPAYAGIADGSPVTTMPYVQMDITNSAAVKSVLESVKPDVVVHCAAWTAVDLAEDEDKQPKVRAINAKGTENIALVCKALNAKMVYISTDYVFDGQGEKPWEPDCKDYKPLNVYGQTKLEGELAVSGNLEKYFIVRIAWVFGLNGKNFIKTMLNVGRTHDTVRVVNDQIGTPTYTLDLSRLLVDMIETDKYGYYHATNEGGYISWFDFTKEIYRQAGLTTNVLPVTTAEYGLSKAARPFNSRLDKSKLVEAGFKPLPTWQDALARYLKEIGETSASPSIQFILPVNWTPSGMAWNVQLISTAAFFGSALTPTAVRACLPFSPRIWTASSLAPFKMAGCSWKSVADCTNPCICTSLSVSPCCNCVMAAAMLFKRQIRAASVAFSAGSSLGTFPVYAEKSPLTLGSWPETTMVSPKRTAGT